MAPDHLKFSGKSCLLGLPEYHLMVPNIQLYKRGASLSASFPSLQLAEVGGLGVEDSHSGSFAEEKPKLYSEAPGLAFYGFSCRIVLF